MTPRRIWICALFVASCCFKVEGFCQDGRCTAECRDRSDQGTSLLQVSAGLLAKVTAHSAADQSFEPFDADMFQDEPVSDEVFHAFGSDVIWKLRERSASLMCKMPGCEASAQIRVFEPINETVKSCRLSFLLHPTDFDDPDSGEVLESIKVNTRMVTKSCYPRMSSCNATTQIPMYSCMRDYPVDMLVDEQGLLLISAKISKLVDECPFEGNMLTAVSTLSCLVASTSSTTTTTTTTATAEPVLPSPLKISMPLVQEPVVMRAPLRCQERGCTAHARFSIDLTETRLKLSGCEISVRINQTDFDREDGTDEKIAYIKLNGEVVATDIHPGKNPCTSSWHDRQPLQPSDMEFEALRKKVEGFTVLDVEAKISDFVDDCAHNGYELDGFVQLNCVAIGDAWDSWEADLHKERAFWAKYR